jgi:hypothetical protein
LIAEAISSGLNIGTATVAEIQADVFAPCALGAVITWPGNAAFASLRAARTTNSRSRAYRGCAQMSKLVQVFSRVQIPEMELFLKNVPSI